MARVEIASLPLGDVQDLAGNAQSGTLATIVDANGSPAIVYASPTGTTTVSPTTDAKGYIPGWLEDGVYTFTIKGTSHTVVAFASHVLLDARKYGVRGDNSTDNATPLTKLAAALRDEGPGACGVLPPGTILTSGPFDYLGNGVRLIGHGRRATVLKKQGNFDLVRIGQTASTGVHVQESTLEHMTLDGANNTGRLIDCVYASNVVVDAIYGRQNNGIGLDIVETWDSWFERIVFEDVNSITEPNISIRSARAATGFGSGTSDSDEIHINRTRCESWKFGALVVDQGTGGTLHPNIIYVDQFKAESAFVRGNPVNVSGLADNVHISHAYISMNSFDGGFSTPQTGIVFNPNQGASLRDCLISNQGTATVLDGANIWTNAAVHVANVVGQYVTAPTSGAHINFAGGGPYEVEHCTAGGAAGVTPVKFASAGQAYGTGSRNIYTSRKQAASLTDGNDTTPVSGTVFYGVIDLPGWDLLTGISYLIGTVGGTNNVIVSLYDSTGALIANSATAGTLVGTLATWQRVPFTAAKSVGPGRYFIGVSFNGTTAHFRTHPAGGDHPTGSQAGTFGTLASITPPTTFTANVAPFAMTY